MKILTRKVSENLEIGTVFKRLKIPKSIDAINIPNFNINVLTPYGYKSIEHLFRTELQSTVTCYFGNNKTLKCSTGHLLKTDRGWKPVVDIQPTDIIETVNGTTYLKRLIHHKKKQSLYDMSVEQVHCYYSNNVLSHNSTALMNIGAHAVQHNLNVVHYTMELSEAYTAQRYDAIVTGIATQNLKYHLDDVESDLTRKVNGNLTIKYYPTKSASVNTLKAHLDQMILLGTKPDLIIIDYADLLRGISKSREKLHEDLEIIYEELRGLAGEYEIPVFSASQSNRCHWVDDMVTTVSGQKRIGDIVEGDAVLTHAGFKKVTRVFETENQPVYRVKTKSGKVIHISDNHEIPCTHGKLKSINTGLSIGDKIFIKK